MRISVGSGDVLAAPVPDDFLRSLPVLNHLLLSPPQTRPRPQPAALCLSPLPSMFFFDLHVCLSLHIVFLRKGN